jgi:hypothetical protein
LSASISQGPRQLGVNDFAVFTIRAAFLLLVLCFADFKSHAALALAFVHHVGVRCFSGCT